MSPEQSGAGVLLNGMLRKMIHCLLMTQPASPALKAATSSSSSSNSNKMLPVLISCHGLVVAIHRCSLLKQKMIKPCASFSSLR